MNGNVTITTSATIDTHTMIFDMKQTPAEIEEYVTQVLVHEIAEHLTRQRRDLIEITNTFDRVTDKNVYTGSIVVMNPKDYKELCNLIDELRKLK